MQRISGTETYLSEHIGHGEGAKKSTDLQADDRHQRAEEGQTTAAGGGVLQHLPGLVNLLAVVSEGSPRRVIGSVEVGSKC